MEVGGWQVLVALYAAADSAVDPTGGLLSYGVLGIVVVCLITGLLVPGYLYKRTEAENDRLRKLIEDKVIPLVERNSEVTGQAIEYMKTQPKRTAR